MNIDKKIIEAYAAENALNYGKAQPGTVLGRVMSENPELRKDAKELMCLVQKVVVLINTKNKAELESLAKGLSKITILSISLLYIEISVSISFLANKE